MRATNWLTLLRAARRSALLAVLALALPPPPPVAAQDPFAVRFNVERGEGGPVRVRGTVANEGRLDALDVYVTVEALDSGGKVLGRGISFVSQSIPQRTTVSFVVSIPAAQSAANFRAHVSSFRFGPAGMQTG